MATSFPDGFLWGTATAAHQTEGGNWNNDWWAWEHAPDTKVEEPSGDATDHYWRYPADLDILVELGFGAYRFSLEWSRIEPEEGEWSSAQLDHYARMIDACHDRGLLPVVTFHHFTTPRWAAADGGWANPSTAERFARFCEHAVARLGDRIAFACTINEPNIVPLMGYLMGMFPPGRNDDLDGYAKATATLVDAHRRAYDALKGGPGDFPVGMTLSMSDWGAEPGHEDKIAGVPSAPRGRLPGGGARRRLLRRAGVLAHSGRRGRRPRARGRRRGAADGLRVLADRGRGVDPARDRGHRLPRVRHGERHRHRRRRAARPLPPRLARRRRRARSTRDSTCAATSTGR